MADTDSPRILIVDDDEIYLASLRRLLRTQYEIVTTKDPVQATKIFAHNGPFAVVIADFKMPFITGIDLFAQIAAIDNATQRILLTGYAELQMAIAAVNRGKITHFLTKPVPAVSLRAAVAEAANIYRLQRSSPASAGPSSPPGPVEATPLCAALTVKEKEVLQLLAKGLSNAEISEALNVTVGTVKTHLSNLFGKLDVNSRAKVVAKCLELGLFSGK